MLNASIQVNLLDGSPSEVLISFSQLDQTVASQSLTGSGTIVIPYLNPTSVTVLADGYAPFSTTITAFHPAVSADVHQMVYQATVNVSMTKLAAAAPPPADDPVVQGFLILEFFANAAAITAVVTLNSVFTPKSTTHSLSPDGERLTLSLDAGTYTVEASAVGYKTYQDSAVRISNEFDKTISVHLEPSAGAIGAPGAAAELRVVPVNASDKTDINLTDVFLNGQKPADADIRWNADHSISFLKTEIGTAYQVTLRATGFKEASDSFAVSQAKQIVHLPMTLAAPDATITMAFQPASKGISWALTGPMSFSGTADEFGKATQIHVAPGTYTLTAASNALAGTLAGQVVAEDTTLPVLTLTEANATASQVALGPSINTGGLPVDPIAYLLADEIAEDTYDNSAYQGYFTSTQCQVYIGDLFIDELAVIQFQLQQNSVPIYGYCSEYLDAYGRGRSIVQGQLVLNYVHQGYLYAALHRYAKMQATPDATSDLQNKVALLAKASADPAQSEEVQTAAAEKLSLLLKTTSPSDVRGANRRLKSSGSQDGYRENPLALQKPFNIRVVIGSGKQQTERWLEAVKLSGNEQIIDSRSGEPIMESYSFLARRLR